MNLGATRFRVVGLTTPDPRAQAPFYRDVLGLAVTEIPDGIEIAAGATRLVFHAAVATPWWPVHFAFNVPVGTLVAIEAALQRSAPLLADEHGNTRFPFASWRAEAVYARDPAGNVLEWIAREDVGAAAGPALGPTRVLGVSELSVTVPDVETFVAAVSAATGLRAYGTPTAEFAAVGDARGLLIVMREGRRVFPELRERAHPSPTSATCETPLAAAFEWPGALLRLTGEPGEPV